MKRLAAFLPVVLSAPAFAHPGHMAEQAGHSHWLALGATLAAAGLVAIVIARRLLARRRRRIANV